MKSYLSVFLFFILMVSGPLISAQNVDFIVHGAVTDQSRQGLSGVNVFIENTKIKTQTDQNGNFTIAYKEGKAILVFNISGYKKLKKTVEFSRNSQPITIQMVDDQSVVQEVTVHGKEK